MRARSLTTWVVAALLAALLGAACGDDGGNEPEAAKGETSAKQAANESDWAPVGEALGIPGKLESGNVYRIGIPRRDLDVAVAHVKIKPSFALGSYAAFLGTPDDALVVGDLVLLETEVNPVLAGLQKAGLEQTALHRHLLGEQPKVMYMHYQGRGQGVDLAHGLRTALEASATPLTPPPAPDKTEFSFHTTALDEALGHQGKDKGGVWGYGIGRAEPVRLSGRELPPSSGVATALNFQDLGSGQAAINGDFAMAPDEVDAVLTALRDAGIDIEATHQHMLSDEPRIIYSHFWATGDAVELARKLRTALDETKSAK